MFKFRRLRETDLNFVFPTFRLGVNHGNEFYDLIDEKLFKEKFDPVIAQILDRSAVNVCCLTEDEDVVLGYCVVEEPKLHWVFVKSDWRKGGIAKALLEPFKIDSVSQLTDLGLKIMKERKSKWAFDPF